jgi:uncharacterized protein (TIGR02996 family)
MAKNETRVTDQAPFIAAIIARPDDDLPRLIYADWLDENGECERAEFIRCQVELARMPSNACAVKIITEADFRLRPLRQDYVEVDNEMLPGLITIEADVRIERNPNAACCGEFVAVKHRDGFIGPFIVRTMRHTVQTTTVETQMELVAKGEPQIRSREDWERFANIDQLRRRERELMTPYNRDVEWFDGPPAVFTNWNQKPQLDYHRGFVHSITCSWSDWQTHASAIQAATPIRKVRLTTEPNWRHYRAEINAMASVFAVNHEVALDRLHCEYPGIEFELPPYRFPTHHHHLCQCEECVMLYGHRRLGPQPPMGIINA